MGRRARVSKNATVGTRGVKAKTPKERRLRRQAVQREYRKTPKGRYQQHKWHAIKRGVEFLLTFAEWCQIWEDSGRYDERGNLHADGYVMARHNDEGPYAVGNVSIKRLAENTAERNRWFAQRTWRDPRDPDYDHVHSAPDVDSAVPSP